MRTFLRVAALIVVTIGLFASGETIAIAQASSSANAPIAGASGGLDLGTILQAMLPGLADTAVALIGLIGAWLAVELKKKWGIDVTAQEAAIEAHNRDALHSAVLTGLGAAIHQFGVDKVDFVPGSPFAEFIVDAVNASVPEAVQLLGAGEAWILQAAAAKFVMPAASPSVAPTAAKAT